MNSPADEARPTIGTMDPKVATIVLVPLLAVVAALLASLVGRVAKIPLVVFEIVLGIVVGPSALGWVPASDALHAVGQFGLAFLFFMAGNEVDFHAIRGRPVRRASLGWLISLAAGVLIGMLLAPDPIAGVYVGIALCSTALGTLMPMLRDAGELRTPFGLAVTAVGAVGEFGPLLAISLFLSGRKPLSAALVLIAFAVIAAAAVWFAARGGHERFHALVRATLHTSGQFAIRFVVLVVAALVGLSLALGLDMLLGAFAAGVICRVLLSGAKEPDARADRDQAGGGGIRRAGSCVLHRDRDHVRPPHAPDRPARAPAAADPPAPAARRARPARLDRRAGGVHVRRPRLPDAVQRAPDCRSSSPSPASAWPTTI